MFLLSSLHRQKDKFTWNTSYFYLNIILSHAKTCTRLCVQECPEGKVIQPKYYKHLKKVLTKAIWADKRLAGFWQISHGKKFVDKPVHHVKLNYVLNKIGI